MLSGKSGTIQVEHGTATITTITKAKSGNLLVVRNLQTLNLLKIFNMFVLTDCSSIKVINSCQRRRKKEIINISFEIPSTFFN